MMAGAMRFLTGVAAAALGLIASYCFTSLVLNQRIANPLELESLIPLVVDREELEAGAEDSQFSGPLYTTGSEAAYLEIRNLQGRTGGKVAALIVDVDFAEDIPMNLSLRFAPTGGSYVSNVTFRQTLSPGRNIVEFPPSAQGLDRVRLSLCEYQGVEMKIREISFNTHLRFSLPLFAGIFLVYGAVVLVGAGKNVSLETPDPGEDVP